MKLRLGPFSILKPSFWDHFEWLGEVGGIVSCTPRLHTDGGLEKKNETVSYGSSPARLDETRKSGLLTPPGRS